MAIRINTGYGELLKSDALNEKISNLVGSNAILNGFTVTAPTTSQVQIKPGKAIVQGCAIEETSDTKTINIDAATLQNSVLYVNLKYTHTTKAVEFVVSNTKSASSELELAELTIVNGGITEVKNRSALSTLDTSVGYLADLEAQKIRDMIYSGFAKLGEIDYSYMSTNPNKIKLKTESIAYVNGYRVNIPKDTIITLNNPPEKEPREDLVFLEAWKDSDFGKDGKLKWRIRVVDNIDFNKVWVQANEGADKYIGLNANGMEYANLPPQGSRQSPITNISWSKVFQNRCTEQYINNAGNMVNPTSGDVGLWSNMPSPNQINDLKKELGTIDGFSYAIPMFRIYRRPSCGYMATNEYNVISPLCNPLDTRKIVSKEKVASSLDKVKVTVEGKSLVNLLGDAGNCEDLSKWSSVNGVIDTNIKLFSNSSIKFEKNNNNKFLELDVACDQTHKYFLSSYCYISAYSSGIIQLTARDYGATVNATISQYDSSILGKWQRTSVIVTGKLNGGMRVRIGDTGATGINTFHIDGVMLYDLTEIYGIGKEPTDIAQLERELPFIDGLQASKSVAIKGIGKNLITDYKVMKTATSNTLITNGIRYDIDSHYYVDINNNFKLQTFKLQTNKNYCFSLTQKIISGAITNRFISILQYNLSNNLIKETSSLPLPDGRINLNFTVLSECSYIRIRLGRSAVSETFSIECTNFQLEEIPLITSPPTEYENYKECQVILPSNLVDNTKSLPNGTRDIIDLINSKFTQNIGRAIFRGATDESWIIYPTTNSLNPNLVCFNITLPNMKIKTQNAISDKIPYKFACWQSADGFYMSNHDTLERIYITIETSKLVTPDPNGFKQWLRTNPITVYYELATPIEYDITDLIKGRLYANPENTTFQVDQVSQKEVKPIGVPNLVTNGDFSNGTTGWTTTNTTNIVVTGNEITFTATSQFSGIRQGTTIVNNKYYFRALVKSTSNQTTLLLRNGYSVKHSGSGKYEILSVLSSTTSTNAGTAFSIEDFGTTFNPIYVKEVFAMDLTAMFGTGNEPSKEWCDKYLDFGTNYKVEIPKGNKALLVERDSKDTFKGVQGNVGIIPSSKYKEGLYTVYYQEPEETHVSPNVTIEVGTKKLELKDNTVVGSLDLTNEIGYKKHSDGARKRYVITGVYTFTNTTSGQSVDVIINSTDYNNIIVGDIFAVSSTYSLKVINKKDNNTVTLLNVGTGGVGTLHSGYKLIPTDRADNELSDIVSKNDLTNLSHQISLTGYNYEQLLEKSYNKLLRGEL